jgi:acyl-CoA reductase-like NAD-dependent aldehyde dehydrogenase
VQESCGRALRDRSEDQVRRLFTYRQPEGCRAPRGLIDQKKVVAGGKSDPQARYIDPTIIYPVTWDDPIMEDEIFGPLLPILTYRFGRRHLAR